MTANISHSESYQLSNQFTEFPLALDPGLQNYQLQASGMNDVTPLLFNFDPFDNGTYRICTILNAGRFCLDIIGGQKTVPHLTMAEAASGQYWTITPTNGGSYKFSNGYTGDGWFLDVFSNTKKAYMSQGDLAGQFWKLDDTPVSESTSQPSSTRGVPILSQPATSGSTTSAGLTTSSSTTSPTSSPGAAPARLCNPQTLVVGGLASLIWLAHCVVAGPVL